MKVLHITESFGGGVATAIASYVRNAPEHEHYLLRTVREGDYLEGDESLLFTAIFELPKNPVLAIHTIRDHTNEVSPDIVHLHSSFAGLYGRVGLRNTRSRKIIYTPHGYAFERKDINPVATSFYRLIEKTLTRNTSIVAACSPREEKLAKQLNAAATYLPNVARTAAATVTSPARVDGTFTVATLGRITAARSPEFYSEVVREVKSRYPNIRFIWIGDGDASSKSEIESTGAVVTGWLTHDEAQQSLSRAQLLLHPAAWDGFPMAILEAASQGVPAIMRDIPAFEHIGPSAKFSTPRDAADLVVRLANREQERFDLLDLWHRVLSDHTPEAQARALNKLYA